MAGGKPLGLVIENDAGKWALYCSIRLVPLPGIVGLKLFPHLMPDLRFDDRLVLAVAHTHLVRDLAHEDRVGQNAVDVTATKEAAKRPGGGAVGDAQGVDRILHGPYGAKFEVSLLDCPDMLGLRLVNHQLPPLHPVPQRNAASHPHALLLGGCDLFPDALTGHFALELGKGEQDIERQ
jgi:hypothetical protein